MKNFIVHLVFLQLFLFLFLQIQSQPLTWDKVYQFPGKDHGNFMKVLQTSNSELYLAGYAEYGWYQYSPGFMRIDTNGNMNWAHSYDFPESIQLITHTLVKLSENSYYSFCFNPLLPVPISEKILVKRSETTNDCWLLKLDNNGDTVFAKHFESIGWINDLIVDDGNLIAVGSTNYYEEDSLYAFHTKTTLLAVDTNGTFLWKKEYFSILDSRANSVVKNVDGNYLITGSTTETFDNFGYIDFPDKMFTLAADESGNLLSEYFSDIEYSDGRKIINSDDGNFAIIGDGLNPANNTIDIILWKFEPANTLFYSAFSELPKEDKACGFNQTPDGGFIICGSIIPLSSTGGAYAFLYLKTNEYGIEEWYTNNHQNFSCANDVLINDHSGYYIVGKGNNAKIVKSDLDGNGLITSTNEDFYFSKDNLLKIYPNPGNNVICIKSTNSPHHFAFMLFNLVGEKAIELYNQGTDSEINTTSLPKGVYFYQITLDNGYTQSGKWIKK